MSEQKGGNVQTPCTVCCENKHPELTDLTQYTPRKISSQKTAAAAVMSEVTKQTLSEKIKGLKNKQETLQSARLQIDKDLRNIAAQINTAKEELALAHIYQDTANEIIQIQDGPAAADREKIHILQSVRYINEEVGIIEHFRDVRFPDIKLFDQWIRRNHATLLPFPKAIGILRNKTRNGQKAEDLNNWIKLWFPYGDYNTYIIIKNGDNLFRVWTRLNVYEYIFPNFKTIDKSPETVETLHRQKLQGITALQSILRTSDIFPNLPQNLQLSEINEIFNDNINIVADSNQCHPIETLRQTIKDCQSGIKKNDVCFVTDYREWDNEGAIIKDECYQIASIHSNGKVYLRKLPLNKHLSGNAGTQVVQKENILPCSIPTEMLYEWLRDRAFRKKYFSHEWLQLCRIVRLKSRCTVSQSQRSQEAFSGRLMIE